MTLQENLITAICHTVKALCLFLMSLLIAAGLYMVVALTGDHYFIGDIALFVVAIIDSTNNGPANEVREFDFGQERTESGAARFVDRALTLCGCHRVPRKCRHDGESSYTSLR